MPVQNIECQIAQAQITRLLAGDSFSNEVLAELETHITECADCRAHVSNRRSALEAMVAEAEPPREMTRNAGAPQINLLTAQFKPGVLEPEADDPKPPPEKRKPQPESIVPAALRQAVVETRREAPNTVQTFWKPLGYSCALAAVLFAMSYIMKNPTAIFGDKAVETLAPQATDTAAAAKSAKATPPSPGKDAGTAASTAGSAVNTSTTPPEAAATAPTKEETAANETAGRAAAAGATSPKDTAKPAPTKGAAPASEEPKPSIFVNLNALDAEPTPRVASTRAPRIRHRARIHRRAAIQHTRPNPRRAHSTLHVYDSDGRLIR